MDKRISFLLVASLVASAALLSCSCTELRRSILGADSPKAGGAVVENATGEAAQAEAPSLRFEKVAEGLTQGTDIQFVPGRDDLVVVLQKIGEAWLLPLLREGDAVRAGERRRLFSTDVQTESELGLLGLAFHPRFAENGRFFVNDNPAEGKLRTRISAWRVDPKTLEGAALERVLLEVEQPYQNHNAGQLAFGPDGFLYVGFGDGGWRADPLKAGQDKGTLLGSMARIDVDTSGEGRAYGIPASNPFVGEEGARPELFAYGLRNPWRFSFDDRGRLIVTDVGQNAWEEVNVVEAGDNLGWSIREGRHCFDPPRRCPTEGLKDPVFEYGRDLGQSVTGGYVYLGSRIPSLRGRYVLADFVSGRLWALQLPDDPASEATSLDLGTFPVRLATFGRDAAGELWAADFGGGGLYRLSPGQ